jgi:hypothetical protein
MSPGDKNSPEAKFYLQLIRLNKIILQEVDF